MLHFFEQIERIVEDAEWVGLAIGISVVVLIVSLIILNFVSCVCVISMRKSLKKIANREQTKKESEKSEKNK